MVQRLKRKMTPGLEDEVEVEEEEEGVKVLSWKGRNNTTEAYSEIVGKDSNTSP